jgi:hypothetical protein
MAIEVVRRVIRRGSKIKNNTRASCYNDRPRTRARPYRELPFVVVGLPSSSGI